MNNYEVALRSPTILKGRPTLSLVVTVKPQHLAAFEILSAIGPHVDEVIVVEVGDHDARSLRHHPILSEKSGTFIKVDEKSCPDLYGRDVSETFSSGNPLDKETCRWAHTGEAFISDWAAVRNLGWNLCTQDWKVFIDGDEMFVNPSYLVSVCYELEELKVGLAVVPHLNVGLESGERATASYWTRRLCRNDNIVGWSGMACETLEGTVKTALIEGSLATYKTASKQQVSSEGAEQFVALYANARKTNWDISPVDFLFMAKTSKYVGMEDFGLAAIDLYLKTSLYTEERAWACALRGEILEARGNFEGATEWYKRSLAEHPGCKSAYRLCRALFIQSKWRECIETFQLALENSNFAHMVDDGTETRDRAYVLVVGAYKQLGMIDEAKVGGEILRKLFPHSQSVDKLCSSVEG